jgi:hypothetical protein
MKATVELPKAFSVREDRELLLIQDLMARPLFVPLSFKVLFV